MEGGAIFVFYFLAFCLLELPICDSGTLPNATDEGETTGRISKLQRVMNLIFEVQKDVQNLSQRIDTLQQAVHEGQASNPCKRPEMLPWPSYPAQAWEFTVQVSGEGGCCSGTTEFTDSSLFRINDEPVSGAPWYRGFNIIALDRRTGQIVRMGQYDTYGSAESAANMVTFIRYGIPDDSIVLVASWDSADTYCGSDCIAALREIGGKRDGFVSRDSYALIGYKGSFCGPASLPGVVKEAYADYPGENGREGKQSPPVTVQATVKQDVCK